jgi:hypothetical protein
LANPKAGYRLDNYIFDKISNRFIKTAFTIIDFCKHLTTHDIVTELIFLKKFFLPFLRKTQLFIGSAEQ